MLRKKFGELELAILHLLKTDEGMSVADVIERIGKGNKYTTIMTVLNRLFIKKQVHREKVGPCYKYYLTRPPQTSLINEWKKRIFGLRSSEMISHLIETSEDLSAEDFLEIEKMIEKTKNSKGLKC